MRTVGTQAMRVRTHRVVGDREAVRNALQHAREDGRLLGLAEPGVLGDGRVHVTVTLLERAPAHKPPPWARLRRWLIALGVLAGLAAVGTVVWLLVLAVLALIALITTVVGWVTAHWLVILVVLGLLLLLFGGGGGCAGLHCGGCRG